MPFSVALTGQSVRLPLRAPVGRSLAIREKRLPGLATSNVARGLADGFCTIRRIDSDLGNLCDRGPGLPCGKRRNYQLGEGPVFVCGSSLGDQLLAKKDKDRRRRPLWCLFADSLRLVVSIDSWTVRSSTPTICYWSFHNLGDVTALKKGPNQGR